VSTVSQRKFSVEIDRAAQLHLRLLFLTPDKPAWHLRPRAAARLQRSRSESHNGLGTVAIPAMVKNILSKGYFI